MKHIVLKNKNTMLLNAIIIFICIAIYLLIEYLLLKIPSEPAHGRILVCKGLMLYFIFPLITIKLIWDSIIILTKTPLLVIKDNSLSVKKLFSNKYIELNLSDIGEIKTHDSKYGGDIQILLKKSRYYLNSNQFSLSGISLPFEVKKHLFDKGIKFGKLSTK